METQSENFIRLISSYINKTPVELTDPNWNDIIELAKIHDLKPILYIILRDSKICSDAEIMKKLKASFMSVARQLVIQDIETESFIKMLNQNCIKHILFKGRVLRDYYPDTVARTMGDIDIAISEDDKERIHKLAVDNGYKFDEINSHLDVSNYIKNGVCFELHTKLIIKNIFDDIDYMGYFSTDFKYAEHISEYTYQFNKEYHLIYIIAHMVKHFNKVGCGLRMVLDIPVIINYFNNDFDWNYIREQLSYLRLVDFADNIFALCNKWFGTDIKPLSKSISSDNIDIVGEYIIAGGVFGDYKKDTDATRMAGKNKFQAVFSLIFPTYSHLKERYVWFGNPPKWLMPVQWIRYWWYWLIVNRKNTFARMKNVVSNDDVVNKHKELISLVGLNKK